MTLDKRRLECYNEITDSWGPFTTRRNFANVDQLREAAIKAGWKPEQLRIAE